MDPKSYERYSRQILFGEIGEAGQQRLLDSSAVNRGLRRAGNGAGQFAGARRRRENSDCRPRFRRAFRTCSGKTCSRNPTRSRALPKAVAAERRLRAINSGVSIEGSSLTWARKMPRNCWAGSRLILDGTDNFRGAFFCSMTLRFISMSPGFMPPSSATYGVTLTVCPGETACLACAVESGRFVLKVRQKNAGESRTATRICAAETLAGAEDTCDTVGVLGQLRE